MPEETTRQILAAIKANTSGAKLTPNLRGVSFKIGSLPLHTVFKTANGIAIARGHFIQHIKNEAAQEHTFKIITAGAQRKKEAKRKY